jgi:hypothetical protein
MDTFIGQISSDIECAGNRWHFSLFNKEKGEEINCVSSIRFETDNPNRELNLKPKSFVKVFGHRPLPGQFSFDRLETPKSSDSK